MLLHSVTAIVSAASETEVPLPVPSVVFPVVALGFFALLAVVTWSYRDVANRHAAKATDRTPHGPTH